MTQRSFIISFPVTTQWPIPNMQTRTRGRGPGEWSRNHHRLWVKFSRAYIPESMHSERIRRSNMAEFLLFGLWWISTHIHSLRHTHLEYGQSVWSPRLKKYIDALEKVQMRATKLVDGLADLNYPERLKRLGLPTLVYRRRRGDMIKIDPSSPPHFNQADNTTANYTRRKHTMENEDHRQTRITTVQWRCGMNCQVVS